jgi:hypothetical protein
MRGFALTPEQAEAVTRAIANAQTERGVPIFWQPGTYLILKGEFEGDYFIPCDESTLGVPLIGRPPMTPDEFPEFSTIIDAVGGLDARISIPNDWIINNEAKE